MYLFVYNLQTKIRISPEHFLIIFQFINDPLCIKMAMKCD